MKKVLLCVMLFLSLFLTSCQSQVKLLADCGKDIAKFEKKMDDANEYALNMEMLMYLDEEEMLNMNINNEMIQDPFYSNVKVDDIEYNFVKIDDELFNIELINGKYVAGRVGDVEDFDQYINVEDQMKLEDLNNIKIEKIKNGYRIYYDLFEYIESADDETLKELFESINEDYIEDYEFTIDFIFNKDKLKINEKIRMDLAILNQEHSIEVNVNMEIVIKDVTPFTEDYYLSLDSMAQELQDPNMVDVTGHTKFYFNMAGSGIVKLHLEEGIYSFNGGSEHFTHIIFDADYNQYKLSYLYALEEGYYYIYLFDFHHNYVELVKH